MRILFIILFICCLIVSVSFELFGIYKVLGLSIFMGLSVLISLSKLYIAINNHNKKLLILLSCITMFFALSIVYVDYRRSQDKIEYGNIKENLQRIEKDIKYTNKSIDEISVKELDIQRLSALYKGKKEKQDEYKNLIAEKKILLNSLSRERILLQRELKGFDVFGAFMEVTCIILVEVLYCFYLIIFNHGKQKEYKPSLFLKKKGFFEKVKKEIENSKKEYKSINKYLIEKLNNDMIELLIYLRSEKYIMYKDNDDHIYTKSNLLNNYFKGLKEELNGR